MPYSQDDASWPALLHFPNTVAVTYRVQCQELREQIAVKDRAIEMYRKLIAEFDRQRSAGA